MKQNERLLVYAVTGFLAIVLLVAVLFGPSGRDAAARSDSGTKGTIGGAGPVAGVPGLGDLLSGPASGKGADKTEPTKVAKDTAPPTTQPVNPPATGLTPLPGQIAAQQPLVANERPLVAMDIVAQKVGAYRRDRTVRLVRARAGDSWDTLVRRWCGARDPFLEEAKSLNEDVNVLRVGQEVCVPWVDDEVVLAAFEASQPKTLVPTGADLGAASTGTPVADAAGPSMVKPTFAEPGSARTGVAKDTRTVGATTEYVVKSGDALWKIAERTYGKQNAKRMVGEIQAANPGLGETLRVGQKIVLPKP
ncbi:MAG: LysM peptidoglycan-binding domain-containing protein [Planctomycetes bacterium]|nr:LysM peptidoglycan-binding domain-containing protein [Planctomycetota bacterium]